MNATLEKEESIDAAQPTVKTPVTRLLDMVQGWERYVDEEEGEYPDTLTTDGIAALYREAGGIADRDYPDLESEQNAVCRFVTERVLAALLHS